MAWRRQSIACLCTCLGGMPETFNASNAATFPEYTSAIARASSLPALPVRVSCITRPAAIISRVTPNGPLGLTATIAMAAIKGAWTCVRSSLNTAEATGDECGNTALESENCDSTP